MSVEVAVPMLFDGGGVIEMARQFAHPWADDRFHGATGSGGKAHPLLQKVIHPSIDLLLLFRDLAPMPFEAIEYFVG